MESGKALQNPRPSHSLEFTNNNKAMPSDLGQKPSTPIIDKFRALLKLREEEAAARVGDGDRTLSTEEIVQLYEEVLAELTFNSKPIITDLTIIAGELRAHGDGIADAICSRIVEVPVDQKLHSLYLLDSIVKNIGKEYVRYFSSRLPEVFCEAYRQVHPDQYNSMRHLFGTWSSVFPQSVLQKIEKELQFSSHVSKQPSNVNSLRASESPQPTHGIHVNPKYIRQMEHSNPDSVGGQRSNIAGSVGCASFTLGTNKLHLSSTSGLGRPLSPLRIKSEDEFAVEKGASPSHPVFDYGLGGAISGNEDTSEWENPNRFESTSTSYNISNGHRYQRPRDLIDAYGSDRRASNNKPPQVGHLGINGMGNKVASKSWQYTEEEEFDWDDMSPTLVGPSRKNDFLPSSVPPYGSIGSRSDFSKFNAPSLESDIRSNHSSQAQLSLLDDSSITAEDSVLPDSGRGIGKQSGFQFESNQKLSSHYPQESWNLPHHFSRSSHPLNGRGRGRDSQIPFPGNGVRSLGFVDKATPYIDKFVDADAQLVRHPGVVSRIGASGPASISAGAWSASIASSSGHWAPVNSQLQHPSLRPDSLQQKHTRTQFDSISASGNILNQGPSSSYNSESKELILKNPPQMLDQHINRNQQNQGLAQLSQKAQNNVFPSVATSVPPHLLAPPLNHGYVQQRHYADMGMVPPNSVPAVQLPIPIQSFPNSSLHLQGGPLPPLPPGPPPASQMILGSQSAGLVVPNQPANAFSGLISSLVAQGLISLTNQTPVEDSVELEFNGDLHKMRHESAITMLYANLPRQCTTCGLRFKCQEEHSSHMDWHVTKNRMSKNRKQKPSRKWFVSSSMWLSGVEALGTDAVPGFLPAEPVVEKKDDEELAVPADEDQNVCALCGEPFDDFYSDETDEWMYKGAVYMNAPNGSTTGMDRSQLGPIVHAKCRSESTAIPSEDFRRDEGGSSEDGSQRKRLRI